MVTSGATIYSTIIGINHRGIRHKNGGCSALLRLEQPDREKIKGPEDGKRRLQAV